MKKQPKTEAILDQFLETVGLKRKPIARDGLCLFRAVSEQLFLTQVYHTNLYEACRMVFIHCGQEWEWTETRVMEILSKMYRRDFLIYENVGEGPTNATNYNFEKKIVLCRVDENQLDSIYTVNYYQDAAICQSIVYDILYRGVFQLDSELTESVSLIREQNKKKLGLVSNRLYDADDLSSSFRGISLSPRDRSPKKVIPPVPYRIAKALDPCIYRNVELDIWEEEKRDLLKRSPEYRERFSTGDKCQVKSNRDHLLGYIQEINDTDNTAVVFVEEFGEKRVVPISSLKLYTHHRYQFKRRRQFFNSDLLTTPTRSKAGFSSLPGTRQLDYQFVQEGVDNYLGTRPLDYQFVQEGVDNYQGTGQLEYQFVQEGVDNYQPVPYSEVDNFQTQEPVYTSDGYSLGNLYYPTEGRYNNPCYYTMENGNQTTGITTYTQQAKTNSNQCYTPAQVQQYGPPPVSGPLMNPYYYSSVVPQSNCMCVPYVEGIPVKDVNMNCIPTKEFAAGNDMPEINIPRLFFNSGVESYRMVCQSGPAVYPVMEVKGGYDPQSTNQMVGNTSGQFTLRPPPILKILSPTSSHNFQHNFTTNQNFKQTSKYQGKELSQKGSELVSSVKANGDKNGVPVKAPANRVSECNDSGCDSDSLGGSAHDDSFKENKKSLKVSMELEKSIDSFIASKDEEIVENGAIEEMVSSSSDQSNGYSKSRTKKKYYMYGSLKLVKPIKDIPPRFLSLLSGSSAERARCEGEPIIIPFLPPKRYHQHHHHYYNNNNSNTNTDKTGSQFTGGLASTPTNFNPEAKCFVPGQMQTTVIHDPSILAYCYDTGMKPDQTGVPMDNSVSPPLNSQSNMYYGASAPIYLPIPHTNLGNGSHSNPASVSNPSNSLLGDGSKQISMHPSFSTGQVCSSYAAPSMQCPVYFTGAIPYQSGQGGYIATNGAAMGSDMQMYYTPYNNGSQTYNLPSQVTQIPQITT